LFVFTNPIEIQGLTSTEPTSWTLENGATGQGGGLYLDNVAFFDGGGLTIDAANAADPGSKAAFISGTGIIDSALRMNGDVYATPTAYGQTLDFFGAVSGSGKYYINTVSGRVAVLEIETSLTDSGNGNTVTFNDAGVGAVLNLGMTDIADNFQAAIDDFGPLDTVNLLNVHVTSATFDDQSNMLSLFDAKHSEVGRLQLDDTIPDGQTFAVSSIGFTDGGTTIRWSNPAFAPVITGNFAGDVGEDSNSPVESLTSNLRFSDANPADTYTYSLKIEGSSPLGSVTVNDGPLLVNSAVSASGDINPLGLSYKVSDSGLDFLQDGERRTDTFYLELTDGSFENKASYAHAYNITLYGENDAPVIGNIDLPTSELTSFSLAGDAGFSATKAPDDFVPGVGNNNNVYDLVPDWASQPGQAVARFFPQAGGAIWHLIDISKDFSLHARLFFGDGVFNPSNSGSGPGITFTLQNEEANAIGSPGSNLGIDASALGDAVGVKFDTYSNPEFSEPAASFAQFFANGDVETTLAANPDQLPIGTVDDGSWHDLVVSWDAASHNLTYTLDGTITDTVQRDLSNTDFGGATQVYAGFTGAVYPTYSLEQVEVVSVANGTQAEGDPDAYSVAMKGSAGGGTTSSSDVMVYFNDPDQLDTHTVTMSPGSVLSAPAYYTGGVIGRLVESSFQDSLNGVGGRVGVHVEVSGTELAALQLGDSLVETLNLSIDDGHHRLPECRHWQCLGERRRPLARGQRQRGDRGHQRRLHRRHACARRRSNDRQPASTRLALRCRKQGRNAPHYLDLRRYEIRSVGRPRRGTAPRHACLHRRRLRPAQCLSGILGAFRCGWRRGGAIALQRKRCDAVMSESGQKHVLPHRNIAVCFTSINRHNR
jgi:VCBS repeat-containing protein